MLYCKTGVCSEKISAMQRTQLKACFCGITYIKLTNVSSVCTVSCPRCTVCTPHFGHCFVSANLSNGRIVVNEWLKWLMLAHIFRKEWQTEPPSSNEQISQLLALVKQSCWTHLLFVNPALPSSASQPGNHHDGFWTNNYIDEHILLRLDSMILHDYLGLLVPLCPFPYAAKWTLRIASPWALARFVDCTHRRIGPRAHWSGKNLRDNCTLKLQLVPGTTGTPKTTNTFWTFAPHLVFGNL